MSNHSFSSRAKNKIPIFFLIVAIVYFGYFRENSPSKSDKIAKTKPLDEKEFKIDEVKINSKPSKKMLGTMNQVHEENILENEVEPKKIPKRKKLSKNQILQKRKLLKKLKNFDPNHL